MKILRSEASEKRRTRSKMILLRLMALITSLRLVISGALANGLREGKVSAAEINLSTSSKEESESVRSRCKEKNSCHVIGSRKPSIASDEAVECDADERYDLD